MSNSVDGIVSAVQTPDGYYVIKAGDAEYLPLSGGAMEGMIELAVSEGLLFGPDKMYHATNGIVMEDAEDGSDYIMFPVGQGLRAEPDNVNMLLRRKDLSAVSMSGYLPLSGGDMSGDVDMGGNVVNFGNVGLANLSDGENFALYFGQEEDPGEITYYPKYTFADQAGGTVEVIPPSDEFDTNVMRGCDLCLALSTALSGVASLNDVSAALSGKSAINIDGRQSDLSIIHISKEDYDDLEDQGGVLSDALYVVSGDYVDHIRNDDGLGISSDLCCTISAGVGTRTTKLATVDDLSGYLKLRPTANQSVDVSDYDVVFSNGDQYVKIDHTAAYIEVGGEDGGITIENGAYNEFKDGAKLAVYPNAQIQFVDGPSYGVRSAISAAATETTIKAGGEPYTFRASGQNVSSDVVRFKDISSLGGQIYFDDQISGVRGYNDLSVTKLWEDDYAALVSSGQAISNMVYITQQTYIDAYGGQVKHVAEPTVSSDAATKNYVDTHGGGGGTIYGNYTGSERISGNVTVASMGGSNVQVYTKWVGSSPRLSVGVFYC